MMEWRRAYRFAPAPPERANRAVDKLAAAINQGLKSPDLNSRLGKLGAAAKKQRGTRERSRHRRA
jgi:hypothetical protein